MAKLAPSSTHLTSAAPHLGAAFFVTKQPFGAVLAAVFGETPTAKSRFSATFTTRTNIHLNVMLLKS